MHLSIDDDSKALLVGDEDENIALDDIDNKWPHSTCSKLNNETVTQRNAAEELKQESEEGSKKLPQVSQNTDRDDVKQDEDFVAKDLLCFAWQIARGMVIIETISTNIKRKWMTKTTKALCVN